ncbi:unnamed protein product [Rhodiola kirilowii]
MGWLTKLLKGSGHSHKISEGQCSHGRYELDRPGEEPTTSTDAWSDIEREEMDRAIALSLAEEEEKSALAHASSDDDQLDGPLHAHPDEDRKGKQVIDNDSYLEEDEQLAKALQESLNVESPPRPRHDNGSIFPPFPFVFPTGYRICAGCNSEIGHGRYLSCMNAFWHPDCFRCHACNLPISDYEYSVSANRPYHKACYKEQNHPKCDVCMHFIPTNMAGLIEYRAHPFWMQKYCPSHERDGTPRCCSCERMEARETQYFSLGDGRKLCLECLDSAVMDTHECQPLYLEIQEFYEGLNMKVEQQVPLLLVEKQALNEAMEGEKHNHHMPETRGLCLSEEHIISTISKRPRIGEGYRITNMFTEPYKLIRRCEVTAILILYGLPRLLTGTILAHEMMHAWLRLKGYPTMSPDVEEGICQVLAHMWLDSEIYAGSGSSSNAASSSSSAAPPPPPPPHSKKGLRSQCEKKLGDFFKHQIETDASPAYGDGFRVGNQAVLKYGLKPTLDHMLMTGSFPI